MTRTRAPQPRGRRSGDGAALREPVSFAATYALTAAECEVLAMLLRGSTPAEIAATRGVAISTVRTQLKRLFAKSGTRGQADLVRRALQAP